VKNKFSDIIADFRTLKHILTSQFFLHFSTFFLFFSPLIQNQPTYYITKAIAHPITLQSLNPSLFLFLIKKIISDPIMFFCVPMST